MVLELFGILAIVGSTISGINYSARSANVQSLSDGFVGSTSQINDGDVYIIKNFSNYRSALTIDNKSNNANLKLGSYGNSLNQKFVLRKYNGYYPREAYLFVPYEDQTFNFSMSDKSNQNNARLVLESNDDKLPSHDQYNKFMLVKGDAENTYKILTGSSNFSKYLAPENFVSSSGANIVQRDYDSSKSDYFDWYLEKAFVAPLNVKSTVSISGTNEVGLDVVVPYDGKYILETSAYDTSKNVDTYITFKDSNYSVISSDDDGGGNRYSRVTVDLKAYSNYHAFIRGFNSSQSGSANVVLRPNKEVYFTSYINNRDIENNRDVLDTREDLSKPLNDLRNAGYFLNRSVNTTLYDLQQIMPDGKSKINHDYFMISSHGGKYGTVAWSPNDSTDSYSIKSTNMANVKLAVWAICHGGKPGNAANSSNAQVSIGWPGLTYTDTSKVYTDKLWESISNGKSIEQSMKDADAAINAAFWYKNWFGWGDDTLKQTKIYRNGNPSTYSRSNSLDLSTFTNLEEVKDKNEKMFEIKNSNYFEELKFDNCNIYLKTINGKATNIFFVEELKENKLLSSNEIIDEEKIQNNPSAVMVFEESPSHKKILENDFILSINGSSSNIKRIQFIDESKGELNERFVNLNTGEDIPDAVIRRAFHV